MLDSPPDSHFLNRGAFADKYGDALAKLSRLPVNPSRDTWWSDVRLAVGTLISLWQNMQIQLDNTIDHVNAVLTQVLDEIEKSVEEPDNELEEVLQMEQEESIRISEEQAPKYTSSTWDPFQE